jgi:hypothetical protein
MAETNIVPRRPWVEARSQTREPTIIYEREIQRRYVRRRLPIWQDRSRVRQASWQHSEGARVPSDKYVVLLRPRGYDVHWGNWHGRSFSFALTSVTRSRQDTDSDAWEFSRLRVLTPASPIRDHCKCGRRNHSPTARQPLATLCKYDSCEDHSPWHQDCNFPSMMSGGFRGEHNDE